MGWGGGSCDSRPAAPWGEKKVGKALSISGQSYWWRSCPVFGQSVKTERGTWFI